MGSGAHQVDVGIITILDGEFEAIHRRLPPQPEIVSGRREYNLCRLPTRNDDHCVIALTRCLEQGNGEAQNVARDLLEDLDPQWLLVVGIAGSIPASELTLGDVVVSTRIHDFTVETVTADHDREYAVAGGPIHPAAGKIIANLGARRGDLGAWSDRATLGADRPRVEIRDDAIHGDEAWRARVRDSLHGHFRDDQTRDPIFVTAPIASSDRLVKDADVIGSWLRTARQIRAIEMEAAGVYRAASAREIPAVAIRGISDVVGFKRDDAWARYACHSAAAFTLAFLRLGAFPSRARRGKPLPPETRYPDAATEQLCHQVAQARERKDRLRAQSQPTVEVDREIRLLRQELREGGRLRSGDALADGRFLLSEQIGRGGFASVWRAFDTARSHDVAIKVLHANLAGDLQRRERFFRGARIMAELDHPSVVRVLGREGDDLGFYYFVMEYIAGGNLHDAVQRQRISRAQVLAVIYAVGDALTRGHALGYVHRDVKPENILLAPDLTARLTDFDLVGAADTTGGTRTGVLGTYIYAAPEQFEQPQDADARADVHGLGMTLVFALHGRALPHRATLDRHRFIDTLDCSAGMNAILKHAIAIEPAERIPDVASFCLALSGLPEIRAQIATELCTDGSWHLLVPFLRFHDRVAAPPEVATAVAMLRHHHAGRRAEAAGDPAEAEARYLEALELQPDHAPTLTAHARLLAEARRWDDHVDALHRMAEVVADPGQRVAALLAAAATCEDQLRDLRRALALCDAALAIERGHPIATARRDALLGHFERWTAETRALLERAERATDAGSAIAMLLEAAAIFQDKLSDQRAAFAALTTAFLRDRRNLATATALESIATALGAWNELLDAVAPLDDRVLALESLGKACANLGNWQRAAELLVRAAAGAPSAERIRLLCAAGHIHLEHLHQVGPAERILADVIALAPEYVEAGTQLAELYYRAENWAALSPLIEMLVRKVGAGHPDPRELGELYYRAARTAEALGDHHKALGHYKAAHDIDSSHLPTLIGRADLLFKLADHDAAGKAYWAILIQNDDRRTDADAVRIYHRLGLVRQALGERRKALSMFEKALEIDPTHRATYEAVIDLHQQQGDWEAAIQATRNLTAVSSSQDRAQLLFEIGEIHRHGLRNPRNAIAAYLEALELAPGDHRLLQKLLDLYTETRQWTKAIETIERLIALEPDPLRRGPYYHSAGTMYLVELKSLDDAASYYGKALDAFFEHPEQLPEAMVPRALMSFDALNNVLTTTRDWKAQERIYRDLIKRLPEPHDSRFHTIRVGLFDGLGEIYRSRLKHYQSATQAFEIAQQLDPTNQLRPDGTDRAEILADLYLVAGLEHTDKAVEQHMRMLRNEPFRYDSYKALRRIYMETGQHDKAWCVCHALAFLHKATPAELKFHDQYRPRGLVRARNAMSPDTWARLVHADENRQISAILGACWHAVATMKAFPHKDFGVMRKDRRLLQDDPLMFSRLFYYVARILNVQLPEVYLVADDKPADIQLANAIEKAELRPSFVVRPHLLQGKSEREIAFLSARRLSFMRPEYYLKLLLPTHTELKVIALSAIAMVQPRLVSPDMAQVVQHYLPELQKRTPPAMLEQLRAAVGPLTDAAPELNLTRWGHAVDAVSHRTGFVMCGDLEVAARIVSADPVNFVGPQIKDKIKELVLYSISEDYFAVRAQLGLAIAN